MRLLIPFATGIILQVYFHILSPCIAIVTLPVVSFLLLPVIHVLSREWEYRWMFGLALNLFLALCGMVLTVDISHSTPLDDRREYRAIVRLVDEPRPRVRSVRVKCQLENILVNQQFQPSHENLLLYFSISDTLASTLKYGDRLALTLHPNEFGRPANPYQFDVGRYMMQERIKYSSFVRPGNWLLMDNDANTVVAFSLRLRGYFLEQFKRYNIGDQQLAVLSALVLGYKDLLDDELRKVYSSVGAMHILAVSGLHVGILFFILTALLNLLPSARVFKFLKLIISLIFLWFFALLTGLSPSVCRSALMFSLVAVGQSFGVRSNIFNSIAAAAFVLLVINPYNLLNLGFQLSFAAVLSIVVFYPFIHRLLYCKNRVAEYIWSLIAVSIAAQLGTFPLTAAYFCQFPNYFILTNTLAIPLATVILYGAVILLAVSPFPVVAVWVGKLLNGLLLLLNAGLKWIEGLPASSTLGIHLSPVQLVLMVLSIVFLALFLIKRRMVHLQATMLFIAVTLLLNIQKNIDISKDELVVFDVPQKSILCVRKAGVANFIYSDTLYMDPVKANGFYLNGYVNHEVSGGRYNTANLDMGHSCLPGVVAIRSYGLAILGCGNITVAFPCNDSVRFIRSGKAIDVDLLMANNHFSDNLLQCIHPRVIVIDSSVPKWKLNRLQLSLVNQTAKIHSISNDGVFRIKIY